MNNKIVPNIERSSQKKFHFDNSFFNEPRMYDYVSLCQIGDLSCYGGYEIPKHEQFCYEISYIVSGKGMYYTNNVAYPVKEGDIYLNLPGESHYGIADRNDPFRYFYLGFDFCKTEDMDNSFVHINKMFNQKKMPLVQDKLDVKYYFTNIFNELVNIKDNSHIMIKSYLHQIIILVYRNFFEAWENEYAPEKFVDKTKQVIYQVIHYIDHNLHAVEELSQFSEKLGYSYSYISHLFSKETGLTIQEYYNKKRFEKAVELLKDGKHSITEIAASLKYQSIHSFSRAFRRTTGIAPSQYQELFHNKAKDVK